MTQTRSNPKCLEATRDEKLREDLNKLYDRLEMC